MDTIGDIFVDSCWQDSENKSYRVVVVANHLDTTTRDIKGFSLRRCCRMGEFKVTDSNRFVSLFLYGELAIYIGERDEGELVFYYGHSGRLARSKSSFLRDFRSADDRG
jgi:hypothetical protein